MNVGTTLEDLKELLKKLYIAEAQEEKDYAAYASSDFENEDLEKAWDESYKTSFAAHEELVAWLVRTSGERISKKTARAIIRDKRKQLEALAGF